MTSDSIANLLDGAERHSSQTLQLQSQGLPLLILNQVDIGLLSNTHLVADRNHVATLHHRTQGKEIVPQVRQFVPVISTSSHGTPYAIHHTFVRNQLVAQQIGQNLVYASVTQIGERDNQRNRDAVVVLHTHLDGRENTERVRRHVTTGEK